MREINNTYTTDYCKQLELAYGEGFMAEGGPFAIDKMFGQINLRNKTILDFGSGLGGMAIYLAKKHQARLHGVEINQPMIEEAEKRIPAELSSMVSYHLLNTDLDFPFPDESFDIVYSRGSIVHLSSREREKAFSEFHRILKKDGKLIIQDWLSPKDNQWGDRIRTLIESETLPLFAYSPKTYVSELEEHGFKDLNASDTTQNYIAYNQQVIDRLSTREIKAQFINLYDEKTYQEHLAGYQGIRDAQANGELLNYNIKANKG